MDLEKGVQSVLNNLNIFDRQALNRYISTKVSVEISKAQEALQNEATEKSKELEKINEDTWDKLSETLSIALNENHISRDRIKKIYTRMAELTKHYEKGLEVENINADLKDVKVVRKDDFWNLIELAIDTSCRDCKRHNKHCSVYQMLKRYDVPKPTGEHCKCKYGYGAD